MHEVPVIITARLAPADQAWADRLRHQYYPPELNLVPAHITLFHHLPSAHMAEIKRRLARLAAETPGLQGWLSRIWQWQKGVAIIVECPALLDIRDMLAESFHGLLTPQDMARPKLHITITNKISTPQARLVGEQLSAMFEPHFVNITGLSAHYYRDGIWENAGYWPFRR